MTAQDAPGRRRGFGMGAATRAILTKRYGPAMTDTRSFAQRQVDAGPLRVAGELTPAERVRLAREGTPDRDGTADRSLDRPTATVGTQPDRADVALGVTDVEHVERPVSADDRRFGQTAHGAAGEGHEPEYTPREYHPVPAELWSDEPAVIIDGAHFSPPIRDLSWARDVSPRPEIDRVR